MPYSMNRAFVARSKIWSILMVMMAVRSMHMPMLDLDRLRLADGDDLAFKS